MKTLPSCAEHLLELITSSLAAASCDTTTSRRDAEHRSTGLVIVIGQRRVGGDETSKNAKRNLV